uniref:Cell division protein FtsQ n=1 Tax=Gloeochaete wittrockiana TaxID=38269 RepID=A0A3G1IVQ8_9EUKA|nr:cell division protein FtsQ [Gloeochaete wittrockiana]ASQ40144.1 cell division protein FtsQ [Gloeochaete wittrockiana]
MKKKKLIKRKISVFNLIKKLTKIFFKFFEYFQLKIIQICNIFSLKILKKKLYIYIKQKTIIFFLYIYIYIQRFLPFIPFLIKRLYSIIFKAINIATLYYNKWRNYLSPKVRFSFILVIALFLQLTEYLNVLKYKSSNIIWNYKFLNISEKKISSIQKYFINSFIWKLNPKQIYLFINKKNINFIKEKTKVCIRKKGIKNKPKCFFKYRDIKSNFENIYLSKIFIKKEFFPFKIKIDTEFNPTTFVKDKNFFGLLDTNGTFVRLHNSYYFHKKSSLKINLLIVKGKNNLFLNIGSNSYKNSSRQFGWYLFQKFIFNSPVKVYEINNINKNNLILKTEYGYIHLGKSYKVHVIKEKLEIIDKIKSAFDYFILDETPLMWNNQRPFFPNEIKSIDITQEIWHKPSYALLYHKNDITKPQWVFRPENLYINPIIKLNRSIREKPDNQNIEFFDDIFKNYNVHQHNKLYRSKYKTYWIDPDKIKNTY